MGSPAQLVDEIRRSPDDDGPRLVWADAVGGERGELVVIQCDLARGGLSAKERIIRKRRQRDLLANHGRAWSGLAGEVHTCTFRRGFVDAVQADGTHLVAHAAQIAEAAPLLTAVSVLGLTRGIYPAGTFGPEAVPLIAELVATPLFARITALDMHRPGVEHVEGEAAYARQFASLGDDVLELLVRDQTVRALRGLGISGSGPGGRGVTALLGSGALVTIERLSLRELVTDDALVALLGTALPALRALDLGVRPDLRPIAPRIPPAVTELRFCEITDDSLAALAASPVARNLERLEVSGGSLDRGAGLFTSFPRLRSLALQNVRLGAGIGYANTQRTAMRVFANQHLPGLVELVAFVDLDEAATRTLVDAFGHQLDLLDLRRNPYALRYVNEFKPKVAGELLVPDGWGATSLLRAGATHQAAWWDHVEFA